MIYQLALTILLGFLFSFFFTDALYFSAGLHQLCTEMAPPSTYAHLYQGIVCGMKLPPGKDYYLLKQAGILHIIVVSGAHLVFLANFLKFFWRGRYSEFAQIFVLFGFVAICEFQMPAMRAWIFVLINSANRHAKLFNPPAFSILLSVMACLAINPSSFYSLSLPMSWLACLGIQIGRNSFTQSLLCYLLLIPVLAQFSALSVWTIAVNAFLTPVICVILFPFSLLTMFIHPLHILGDWGWQGLMAICSVLNAYIGKGFELELFLNTLALWIFPTLVNLAMIRSTNTNPLP